MKELVNDLIEGDESVSKFTDFKNLSNSELHEAINLLINSNHFSEDKKNFILTNSWKIHYKQRPPTIQEFLTEKWIGPTATTLFPHIKKWLIDFFSPESRYRNLIMSASIAAGKSTTGALANIFIATHIALMRDPKKFFGSSKSSSFLQALLSFTKDKAGQVLLQKVVKILISAPKFRRVRQEERIEIGQKETPDKIIWTTSSRMGSLQYQNDIHMAVASNAYDMLGLDMISATLSEISFFLERGFSPEYIWRIFQDAKGRINSRFGNQFLTACILDSSPNDIDESPIDKYVFNGEAFKDKTNYVVTGTYWEFLPKKNPIWYKTKETFPVFRGDSGNPAQILNENETHKYSKDEIYNVPIDLKQLFIDNPVKMVKDYCGWPSGSLNKLIPDYSIIDKMFDDELINIYTDIQVPSTKTPEKLIWNQIKDKFFININGKYEFYRAPLEIRYLHIDQSETGDTTGISMCHPELNKKGEVIYILDFTIAINPRKQRINLEAVPCFIEDLCKVGNIKIGKITFDRYQSSMAIQKLKLKGYNVELLSVDSIINPYMTLIAYMNNERIKVGRNIYLKNNLKSLREVKTNSGKRKIDHLIGKVDKTNTNLKWEISTIGFYGKDISDSTCGAVWNCINEYSGTPRYSYFPSEKKQEKGKDKGINQNVLDQIAEMGFNL